MVTKNYAARFADEIMNTVKDNNLGLKYTRLTSKTGILTDFNKNNIVKYQIWLGPYIKMKEIKTGVLKVLGFDQRNRNLNLENGLLRINDE